ncbi:MAG TPA: thiol peroxidase [Rectinemataceae bacterium]|nr:thiol peroxidase [Rectinemataceae bacterium]
MAKITLKGNTISTIGTLPALGSKAPDFLLTKRDLSDATLADFAGMVKILNIVPSLDTGVCAASARAFNKAADSLGGAVVLTISRDLPFAQGRFCEAEGIKSVVPLSELRDLDFGKDYGVEIIDGPMAGLLSRAVVVLDANDKIVYTQQVPEIAQEPDYKSALDAAKKLLAANGGTI